MSANSAGCVELTGTGAGVHNNRLADNQTIPYEFADGLAGVGVGDLTDLIWVKPNLTFTAANHGGREAFLGAKVDPVEGKKKFLLAHE